MAHEITIRDDGFAEAAFSMTPAWHGLGKVFDHPMTSREALTGAGLDWQVIQQPVGTLDQNGQWSTLDGYYANIREDSGVVLGVVRNQYKVVQNVEAFQFLDRLVDDNSIRFESAFSIRGGRKVILLARMPGADEVVKGDHLLRYILLSLSHDGTEAIRFGPTSVRVVCANTYALANRESTIRDLVVPHKGNVESKLRQARYILATLSQEFAAHVNIVRQLAARKLSQKEWADFLDAVCPPPLPTLGKRLARIMEAARDEVTQKFRQNNQNLPGIEGTAWAAFCAFSEFVDHLPRRGRTEQERLETRFNVCLFGDGQARKDHAFAVVQDIAGLAA